MGLESPRNRKAAMEAKKFTALTKAATAAGAIIAGANMLPKNPERPSPSESSSAQREMDRQRLKEELAFAPHVRFDESSFSKEELKCLTDNVYHEARGETVEGRFGVIAATLGRLLDEKFPNTICGVVYQRNAFSWTSDKKILERPINAQEYLKIATEVYELTKEKTIDSAAAVARLEAGLPKGAIFYKKTNFTGSKAVEKFFSKLEKVATIGRHDFYVALSPGLIKNDEPVPLPHADPRDKSAPHKRKIARSKLH